MYEQNTKEHILERMLSLLPDDLDKREGSIIYDALAPAAAELSYAYIALDEVLRESFADTCGREMLIKRAAERGIEPTPPVAAEYLCRVNIEIPTGTQFTCDKLYFKVNEARGEDLCILKCETPGKIGNQISGKLIPVQYIDDFEKIEIVELSVAGEDAEDTEHFRKRYFMNLETAAFGGNVSDYKEKTNAISGVGGCKIYPVWNGGGTVKVVFCDSSFKIPNSGLIETVQDTLDPVANSGIGNGIAPIGHHVTVTGANGVTVDVETHLTLETDWSFDDVIPLLEQETDAYFYELGSEWESNERLVVRISQLEMRFLNLSQVIDVEGTKLNGSAENLILLPDDIPVRGAIWEI